MLRKGQFCAEPLEWTDSAQGCSIYLLRKAPLTHPFFRTPSLTSEQSICTCTSPACPTATPGCTCGDGSTQPHALHDTDKGRPKMLHQAPCASGGWRPAMHIDHMIRHACCNNARPDHHRWLVLIS